LVWAQFEPPSLNLFSYSHSWPGTLKAFANLFWCLCCHYHVCLLACLNSCNSWLLVSHIVQLGIIFSITFRAIIFYKIGMMPARCSRYLIKKSTKKNVTWTCLYKYAIFSWSQYVFERLNLIDIKCMCILII
jgi:hypothetical protein